MEKSIYFKDKNKELTEMNKKRIIIEGEKVHYVGYRPFLLKKARMLGIPNYEADNVEEHGKQKVIVSVCGEEKQVQEFVNFAKENYPKKANVSRAWEDPNPPERVMPIDEYQKVLDSEQHNTMVQAGLMMIDMQKQTIEVLGGKIDSVGMKVDTVGEKVDTVGNKVDALREETKQDFNRMDTKYDKVSNKLDKIDKTLDKLTKAILKLAEKSAK